MTVEKLFKASGLSGVFDTSLPQQMFNTISDALGFNPLGHFVWWYPNRDDEEYVMGGKLLPVSRLFALAVERRKLIETKERPISRDVMIERMRKRGIDERSIQGEDMLADIERDQREWNENCKRDGIDPSVSFACFSSDNK